jgi:predicted alpha/beta hydrolase family esterase
VGIDPGRQEGVKEIAMTRARQILFIQGGGAGAHDEWDGKLADSLRRELGDGYEVRYPRMPEEGDPGYARWSAAIRRELADLDNGAAVIGHSVGAAILIGALAGRPPQTGLAAVVLIAAPFVGEGGWPSGEFELTGELGARLPAGAGACVSRDGGRDRPAVACRPVCTGDLTGAGAPTARAGSSAEQRPERSG